jgi:hypothetical protein
VAARKQPAGVRGRGGRVEACWGEEGRRRVEEEDV